MYVFAAQNIILLSQNVVSIQAIHLSIKRSGKSWCYFVMFILDIVTLATVQQINF